MFLKYQSFLPNWIGETFFSLVYKNKEKFYLTPKLPLHL
jgi:hypothetical protein